MEVFWSKTSITEGQYKTSELVPSRRCFETSIIVKTFITHCGISGTYEAAMKGLPVVAIPLFRDQPYNCCKLTKRGGMGMELKLNTMTETGLREAVKEVMSNPEFLKNAKHVFALLQDTEIPPKKNFSTGWTMSNVIMGHNILFQKQHWA